MEGDVKNRAFKSAVCKWACLISDEKQDIKLCLDINNDNQHFDSVFVLFINKSDKSSTTLLVNDLHPNTTIQHGVLFQQFDFYIHVFGLVTTRTHTSSYSTIVGYGKVEYSIRDNTFDGKLHLLTVSLEQQGNKMPNSFDLSQTTLPITVSKDLPSKYVLETSCAFTTPVDVIIFVQHNSRRHICFLSTVYLQYTLPMTIPSATLVMYSVLVGYRQSTSALMGGYYLSKTANGCKLLSFKTFLNQSDICTLYFLSVRFGDKIGWRNMRQIWFFYRNKSEQYFDTIFGHLNGEMRPYLKNHGGEQGSILNGRVKGLFFSTMVDLRTNIPHPFSYYGPVRFYVNATAMLNSNSCLYFSDFYYHNTKHHITLILTRKFSPCDNLCKLYLTQLNLYQNPYLCISNGNTVIANMDFVVEIFYTETINLFMAIAANQGFMRRTPTIGRGYAPPSGKPKRSSCEHCNIYRIQT